MAGAFKKDGELLKLFLQRGFIYPDLTDKRERFSTKFEGMLGIGYALYNCYNTARRGYQRVFAVAFYLKVNFISGLEPGKM